MKKPLFFLLLAALPFGSLSFAQSGIELGVILGASTYQGDVTENQLWEFGQTSIGAGAFARFTISDNWYMRTGLTYLRIYGDDMDNADRDRRAFVFHNNLVELSLIGEWEPWAAKRREGGFAVSPYLLGGAGFLYTNPQVDFSRFTGDLLTRNVIRDRDTPYSKFRIVIPAGAGVKFQINDAWMLGLEATARYPFTDYLDGISYSANPNKNDWYALFGLSVAKQLGR